MINQDYQSYFVKVEGRKFLVTYRVGAYSILTYSDSQVVSSGFKHYKLNQRSDLIQQKAKIFPIKNSF